MISAMFAVATILATGPTAAAETAAPPAAAADKAKSEAETARGDEVVCRTEQVLGTRFPKRVCRTRAAIAAQRETDQAEIGRIQREQRLITN
jgi:hypothetical protein